jgi:hypothetical protein
MRAYPKCPLSLRERARVRAIESQVMNVIAMSVGVPFPAAVSRRLLRHCLSETQ